MKGRLRKVLGIATLLVALGAAGAWRLVQRDSPLERAEAALNRGDLVAADTLLRDACRQRPEELRPWLLRVQTLRRLGRVEEASAALLQAKKRGLPEHDGYREFGLLLANEDFAHTVGALERVLSERPDDCEVAEALAENYMRLRRWSKADRVYSIWLHVQPDHVPALYGRARARWERQRYSAMADDCRAILKQAPRHFHARLLFAHYLMFAGQVGDAQEEYDRCRQYRPDRFEPLVGLANCALLRNQLDAAQDQLREALELEPGAAAVDKALADVYVQKQRYDLAAWYLSEAVRQQPDDMVAHGKLAQVLRHLGRTREAAKHEEISRKLDPEK